MKKEEIVELIEEELIEGDEAERDREFEKDMYGIEMLRCVVSCDESGCRIEKLNDCKRMNSNMKHDYEMKEES
ncbi:hypothetical protein [Staphylococcus epidermidis]|uniref:hypothetical protein n=1 Tax=Staphylococcus epidermidis TaxID=1282 RepID=UPI0011A9CA0B|nr:hypothetical protein [Staphylococcus epidermidis]